MTALASARLTVLLYSMFSASSFSVTGIGVAMDAYHFTLLFIGFFRLTILYLSIWIWY